MPEGILLPDAELLRFGSVENLATRSRALLEQQKRSWELLGRNYAALNSVRTRAIEFNGFAIELQFNPARITSAAAKVDPKSIRERPCFLCNLPAEQRGLLFAEEYLVLCNPFPILPEHFTVVNREHVPQRIAAAFPALLDLAEAMGPRYTAFYNGPRCGASAPDHLHLQAGDKGFMRIDREYDVVKSRYAEPIVEGPALTVFGVQKYVRRFFAFESSDRAVLLAAFNAFYRAVEAIAPNDEEPMMNVIVSHAPAAAGGGRYRETGQWRVVIFPRGQHRPSVFFLEGDAKVTVSPGAVDLGGVLITPVERDYDRLTREDVVNIFEEVCAPADLFAAIRSRMQPELEQISR